MRDPETPKERRWRWAAAVALASATAACPTRGPVNPYFLGAEGDGGDGKDAAPDANEPLGPPCTPPMAVRRTDPCPGRPNCGLPSQARVNVTGARSTLTDFQVLVTLPPAVRSAAGPACDRLVFRTMTGEWAPHFATDCAMGQVWVKVPTIQPSGTALTVHYGGSTAPMGAQSYDDTFDRVPLRAQGLVAAYTFDEGMGTRSCPAGGTAAGMTPFDAYIHDTPYGRSMGEVRGRLPALWSRDAPPSLLAPGNAAARFSRNQSSLAFERSTAADPGNPMRTVIDRLVNWRTEANTPYAEASLQFTAGIWVYTETPANEFEDNFQTVVCAGMPERPRPPFPGATLEGISIFNPWAIFFRSDDADNTFLQGNSCVFPCINVDQYVHITTKRPFTREAFTRRWHFAAMTLDTTSRPHATRRSYFDGQMYEFPSDLNLFPEDTYCPMGMCRYPPDTAIYYYDAPVVIGSDLNGGEARLGLEGKVDDFFVMSRAVSPDEMRAIRERRQYSPDPVTATFQ